MELGGDTKAVLLLAAVMFLWALLLGVWKYRQMLAAEDGLAHPPVNLLAAGAMAFYFFAAVGGYSLHGLLVAGFLDAQIF